MIVYIDKNRYIGNLEERLYSQLEERFYGKNVAVGVNKRVGNSYRPKQTPNPKPKPDITSNSNNPVNNSTNSTNVGGSGHMDTMRQRYDRSMARRQRVEANNQNKDVFQQPLNNYIDPNTQAPKPPSNQSQNQGSNSADTKPPIVSTEQTQKATEITSVANNSADAAKNPAIKKAEEQQQPPVEPIKPVGTQQPPIEPVKPVETQQPGSGAGDTGGTDAATSQTAATTTTDTTTNTTNTNEEKKKGMGIGGKIALGAAGTIGIGAMGYAMGSGNNKDDDKKSY